MKKLILPSLLVLVVALQTGCCTKKYCGGTTFPSTVMSFPNAPFETQSFKGVVTKIDKKTGKVVSRSEKTFYKGIVTSLWDYDPNENLHDLQIVIATDYSAPDTVTDISYERKEERISCNKCFPVGEESDVVVTYKNLQLVLNNITYTAQDTLVFY